MKFSRNVAVIGLGYVGLPVALAFSKEHKTIGFDVDGKRIKELKKGIDRNKEFSTDEIKGASFALSENQFTSRPGRDHRITQLGCG